MTDRTDLTATIAELRHRLTEVKANRKEHWLTTPGYAPFALACEAHLPAILDALEAAQQKAATAEWEKKQLRDGLNRFSEELIKAQRENERLRAIADAAREFEAGLSEYCDGPERDRLRAELAKGQE